VLLELHRKGGTLCQPAREGRQHCPLIVRPTSEDNVTAHLVTVLQTLNPRHWVSDLLNVGLGAERFRRQVYRSFRIRPWVTKPPFPRSLLPWDEGGTQVDVQFTWENPPTTVYVECKYGSGLSTRTSRNDGRSEFPADQLVRNVRVGLLDAGYYRTETLFESQPRDFAVLLLAPEPGNPLVREYRDLARLRTAIPHGERITSWPGLPFIGEIGYADIRHVLRSRYRFYTRAERPLIDALLEYLAFKHGTRPNRTTLMTAPDE
jgi:hypothetical protein